MLNNSSCNYYSDQDRMILGLSRITSNSLSVLACLFVITIATVYKKYIFVFQRLVLYLTASILLNSIAYIIHGASYNLIPVCKRYCQALAFFDTYLPLCIVLSVACIIAELYLYGLKKRDTSNLKWIYAAFIFIMPAAVSWVPFVFNQFGYTGTKCSIIYHKEDCRLDLVGLMLIIVLWWVPLISVYVITGPIYLCILCRISRQGRTEYTPLIEVDGNRIHQQTAKDLGYFKWIPLIEVIIHLFSIVPMVMCYGGQVPTPLLSASSIVIGIQGGTIAILITFDPNTCKVLRWNKFKAAWRQNIMKRSFIEEYPIVRGEFTETVE